MNTTDIQPDTQEETTALPTLGVASALAAAAALTACGGGESEPASGAAGSERAQAMALVGTTKPSTLEAWRFLNQATMGATDTDVKYVAANGYDSWLNQQFALAPTSYVSHYMSFVGTPAPNDPGGPTNERWAQAAWWKQALTGKDQLRQRVCFALSQITVVSLTNDTTSFFPILVAGWQEMLSKNCFGSYRDYIEQVCKQPAMGRYLSHFANIRPDRVSGRIPDQNFARELTQLFTIGLIKLDMYGNPVVDGSGKPVPASSTASTDVRVLSHVFTGWAYGDNPDTGAQYGYGGGPGGTRNDKALTVPMKGFPSQHATDADIRYSLAQQFGLPQADEAGIAISLFEKPFSMGTSPQASLTKVLDIFFGTAGDATNAHPNVAPFIARQMIQRLVTSNPSPAYVYRVATAFKNSYWSMKTLVRAILLDDEARKPVSYQVNTYGKVREPLLRITHLLRAFKTTVQANANYFLDFTSSPYNNTRALALNQAPLMAPSVFNYFSPGFRLNQGEMAKLGKVAPEMQILTETSAATYINAVYDIIVNGYFSSQVQLDLSDEVSVAGTPSAVVAKINTKLFGGSMSTELATYLSNSFTAANASADALTKVRTAVLLAMASPEYLIQK